MLGKGFGTAVTKLFKKTDPDTSFEAALSIDTKKCEQLVYETIASFPDGCIQDEVLQVLSFLPYSSVTARFKALKDKGYIEVIGTRKGRSGKNQSVLKVSTDESEACEELGRKSGWRKRQISDKQEEVIKQYEREKLIKETAKKCAEIADIAEPYKSSDSIKKHFGVEE